MPDNNYPTNTQGQPDQKSQLLTKEIYKRGLELLKEKKHAENLLYHISEAVVAINKDGKVSIMNKAAEDLTGISSKEAEGKKLDELLEIFKDKDEKISSSDYCFKPYDVFLDNLMTSSKKYVKLQSSTIENAEGENECVVTFTDVTKEKLLEKSKDEFISVASHELRTPMTVIKSYLWMLQNGKGGDLNQKQRNYLEKAAGGVERLLSMINDTLNTSKIDQGRIQLKIEQIDIKNVLDDLIPDFTIKASEKGLKLTSSVDDGIKHIYADLGKFREMLTNLLGNAVKFTNEGFVSLSVKKEGDSFVRFEISDTGKGIDGKDMEKLFQKFGRIDNSYQTVAEAGGTGLGLYIVKSYVEAMGGKIGVHSDGSGKGSQFWFTLPSEYYEIPENLREFTITSLASKTNLEVTTICPM